MIQEEPFSQTLGFPNQFVGRNVDSRLNRSPLSHGLHEGCDDPRAEPPALVLIEVHMGCEPIRESAAAFEPCGCANQSVPPAFAGTAGDDAPTELHRKIKLLIHFRPNRLKMLEDND